jgi:hypothetical protein
MTKAEIRHQIAVLTLQLVNGTKLFEDRRPEDEYIPQPGHNLCVHLGPVSTDFDAILVVDVNLTKADFINAGYPLKKPAGKKRKS